MGDRNNPIPTNVVEFLDKASDAYGRHKADEFSQWMWSMCCETESPIEQLFFVAMNLVSHINHLDVYVTSDFAAHKRDDILIIPQWHVGKYRVDFAICRHPIDKIVCVELDGHDFHDRNERQRRYEKSRDRFLTAKGYSVLHFTGSEIVKDPCAAAVEVFKVVCDGAEYAVHPFEDK